MAVRIDSGDVFPEAALSVSKNLGIMLGRTTDFKPAKFACQQDGANSSGVTVSFANQYARPEIVNRLIVTNDRVLAT